MRLYSINMKTAEFCQINIYIYIKKNKNLLCPKDTMPYLYVSQSITTLYTENACKH